MTDTGVAERALRTRYWNALRARRAALPETVDPSARRRERERAWRAWADARVAERPENETIWRGLLSLRTGGDVPGKYIGERRDGSELAGYTTGDFERFHYGIEEWVSPVLLRLHEERRVDLGLKTLRPWDTGLTHALEPHSVPEGTEATLLGVVGKRPVQRSAIRTLHELRGFGDPAERHGLFERLLLRWADAAQIDSFEAWAYNQPDRAMDPETCGERWRSGWLLYLPGVDWTGLEAAEATEWHDRWPIFVAPLHAIEPAVGQLAAIGWWAQHDSDAEAAIAALGDTMPIPVPMPDEHAVREAVEALEGASSV